MRQILEAWWEGETGLLILLGGTVEYDRELMRIASVGVRAVSAAP
ncbi:hypothetical protein ACIP39_11935 [Streptomyces tibetensis]